MLALDNIRQEFAKFLSEDPSGRWRMDAALSHVVQIAYQQGIEDGSRQKQDDPIYGGYWGGPPVSTSAYLGRTLLKSTTYAKPTWIPMKEKI